MIAKSLQSEQSIRDTCIYKLMFKKNQTTHYPIYVLHKQICYIWDPFYGIYANSASAKCYIVPIVYIFICYTWDTT